MRGPNLLQLLHLTCCKYFLVFSSDFSLSPCSCCSFVSFNHSLQCSFLCPHLLQWQHLTLNLGVCLGFAPFFWNLALFWLAERGFHLLPILFLFQTACTFLLIISSTQLKIMFSFSIQSWHGQPQNCILEGDLPRCELSKSHHLLDDSTCLTSSPEWTRMLTTQ